MLDRFGAQAALGRQPTPREMRRMLLAERAAAAYMGWQRAEDEAAWANAHPEEWDLINWLKKVSNGE